MKCPLGGTRVGEIIVDCLENDCAWWVGAEQPEKRECAIKNIAYYLRKILVAGVKR